MFSSLRDTQTDQHVKERLAADTLTIPLFYQLNLADHVTQCKDSNDASVIMAWGCAG